MTLMSVHHAKFEPDLVARLGDQCRHRANVNSVQAFELADDHGALIKVKRDGARTVDDHIFESHPQIESASRHQHNFERHGP